MVLNHWREIFLRWYDEIVGMYAKDAVETHFKKKALKSCSWAFSAHGRRPTNQPWLSSGQILYSSSYRLFWLLILQYTQETQFKSVGDPTVCCFSICRRLSPNRSVQQRPLPGWQQEASCQLTHILVPCELCWNIPLSYMQPYLCCRQQYELLHIMFFC